ncbi:MAG: DNA polymerase III subunit beta [Negativicutes bacterium]|nr:DNA polymerase III subunit beta [Negativicutes bacterium]
MDFFVRKTSFANVLSIFNRLNSGRGNALNIIDNTPVNTVYLSTSDSQLSVAFCGQETSAQATIAADVVKNGCCLVSQRYLYDFVRQLPGEEVHCFTDRSESFLSVMADDPQVKSHIDLPLAEKGQIHDFPHLISGNQCRIPAAKLARQIKQTIFVCEGTDSNRPHLTGIMIKKEGSLLSLTTTSSSRIAYSCQLLEETTGQDNFSIIVPGRVMGEIEKTIETLGDIDVVLTWHKSTLAFNIEQGKECRLNIVSRLLEGKMPDIKRYIPENFRTVIRIERQVFCDALSRMAVIVDKGFPILVAEIDAEAGTILLRSHAVTVCHWRDEVCCQIDGESVKLMFGFDNIREVARNCRGSHILLKCNGEERPVIVCDADDSDSLYVIAPVKENVVG